MIFLNGKAAMIKWVDEELQRPVWGNSDIQHVKLQHVLLCMENSSFPAISKALIMVIIDSSLTSPIRGMKENSFMFNEYDCGTVNMQKCNQWSMKHNVVVLQQRLLVTRGQHGQHTS